MALLIGDQFTSSSYPAPIKRLRKTIRPFPLFFFFNDTATTEIYTLSLHDALPIYRLLNWKRLRAPFWPYFLRSLERESRLTSRSEEHTSELQSPDHPVCRLLLEKKKTAANKQPPPGSTHPPAPQPSSTSPMT